ncbi:MAG: L-seryl-tRNA(Ser) seleniumtransferase, partial [Bradymonadia bacterium]
RGGRGAGVRARLAALVGAEDALVVNNCAAAVMLALTAVARDRSVLISRGELVEIGGGFRVPTVITSAGAHLIEVGTTNRTHLRDYVDAVTDDVAAIVRVHHGNFRQIGFTTRPALSDLVQVGPPVIVDQGSGALFEDDPDSLSVKSALAAGANLVCFSGDKLLGGPQAGIIVGDHVWVEKLRRHPLFRALRVDKTIQAALEGTLDAWAADDALPIRDMRAVSIAALTAEVERWQAALGGPVAAEVLALEGTIGGGSLPGRTWPSVGLAIRRPAPEALAAALRGGDPPVIGRIHKGALLFDARTVLPLGQGDALVASIRAAISRLS